MCRTELALIALVMVGCTAGDDVPAPRIASVSPDHATPGSAVMVVGDFFCQDPEGDQCDGNGSVAFDATPANIGMYSEQLIMVEVPSVTAGPVKVTVTAAGRTSNDVDFRIELP